MLHYVFTDGLSMYPYVLICGESCGTVHLYQQRSLRIMYLYPGIPGKNKNEIRKD
jgi:hypothetical protein